MTRDPEILKSWLLIIFRIVTVCVTAVPIIYALTPWRTKPVGRIVMAQAVSIALAFNLTLLFQDLWRPKDILILFWISTSVYSFIGVSYAWLAVYIFKTNFVRKRVFWVLFSDKFYQFMKRVVQLGLPAGGTLYFSLAQIWGLPNAEQVVGSVAAVNLFLGILLGVSSKTYHNSEASNDGTLVVTPTEDGTQVRMKSVDLEALASRQTITFKVVHPSEEPQINY